MQCVAFTWDSCPLIVKSATGPFSQPALLIPILFSNKIPILLQKIFYLLLLLLSSIKMNALNEQIKPVTNIILIQYNLPSENFFLWHWLHGIFLVEKSGSNQDIELHTIVTISILMLTHISAKQVCKINECWKQFLPWTCFSNLKHWFSGYGGLNQPGWSDLERIPHKSTF